MLSKELSQCVSFINELEKLKVIYRQNSVLDKSRNENSAEHSWHVALMAIILMDYSNAPNLDILKVVQMLLIHDIVEIDAGDTFLYDEESNKSKKERELSASKRIFGLAPRPIEEKLTHIWNEFEEGVTAEAKFAAAIDSLQPLMNHLHTKNLKYKDHNVRTEQVLEKKKHIAEGSSTLWEFAKGVIMESEKIGLYLK